MQEEGLSLERWANFYLVASTAARVPGLMEDVAIYSRALSAGEVKALYDAGGSTYACIATP